MQVQWSRKRGLSALAMAVLSTTVCFSWSQTRSQNPTPKAPMTTQNASTQSLITREDVTVTSDPSIHLFVRQVKLQGQTPPERVPILLLHGGGGAGLASFDVNVPGYSLAEDFAKAGHPVYPIAEDPTLSSSAGWGL